MDTIKGKVKRIVAEQLGVDVFEITDESSLRDDLNADSLDMLELTLALGDEFDLDIPDEDAEPILRVGDIVAYLEQRLAVNPPSAA